MSFDNKAIFKAYAGVVTAIDSAEGCFDANGNKVTIDQTKVDAARVTLDAEAAAAAYQEERKRAYPSIREQLDYIYHNGIDKWKTDIVDPVKTKYPKP